MSWLVRGDLLGAQRGTCAASLPCVIDLTPQAARAYSCFLRELCLDGLPPLSRKHHLISPGRGFLASPSRCSPLFQLFLISSLCLPLLCGLLEGLIYAIFHPQTQLYLLYANTPHWMVGQVHVVCLGEADGLVHSEHAMGPSDYVNVQTSLIWISQFNSYWQMFTHP